MADDGHSRVQEAVTAMQRDRLFDILCGMLAARGRDETLFGGRIGVARRAFCRMAPEGGLVHAYFEIPLFGPPMLDVHCSLTHEQSAWPLGKDASDDWRAAYAWFRDAGPFETEADEVRATAVVVTGTTANTAHITSPRINARKPAVDNHGPGFETLIALSKSSALAMRFRADFLNKLFSLSSAMYAPSRLQAVRINDACCALQPL